MMVFKRLFLLFVAALLFSTTLPVVVAPRVGALTSSQINLYRSGNYWYDTGTAGTFCNSGGGTITLTGSNNEEKAYNYFRARGLSAEQSAAILGNLYAESRVDPARKQGSGYQTFSDISEVANSDGADGYGLAQWTFPTRQDAWVAYTTQKGWDILELGSQLEWIWQEWPSHEDYGKEEFLAAEGLRQLTWVFLSYYEIPDSISGYVQQLTQPTSGDALDSLDGREAYAEEFLTRFGNNTVATVDTPSQCLVGADSTDFSASGVEIDGSPVWDESLGRDNCPAASSDGAKALAKFISETWAPPVEGISDTIVCRRINGKASRLVSVHGLGRALDITVNSLDPAGLQTGNEIRNWLINNSAAIGVQRVIWNKYSWNSQRDGWNEYCPCPPNNPHTNHVHAEINLDGANMLLPWYSGR